MSTMAELVGQAAQQATAEQGKTVGDAINAYTMAQRTENARQELEMEKANHEMNKMNWLGQQVQAIHAADGPSRQLLADALKKQLPQVLPNANPDFPTLLAKDTEFSGGTMIAFKNVLNGTATPEDYAQVNSYASAATPSQLDMSKHLIAAHAQIEAGKAKQQSYEDRIISQQIMGAQQQANKIMTGSQFDQMAEGAIRTRKLIDNAMGEKDPTKKIARTQQLLETLSQEEAKLATGKANFDAASAEGIAIRQQDAKMIRWIDQLKTGVTDVKTLDAKLKNARNEVNELGGSYVNALNRAIDANANLATEHQAPTWAKAKAAVAKKYGNYFDTSGSAVETAAAGAAPAGAPQQAPAAPPNPLPYGSDPKEIEANYKKFKAWQAHQQAGDGN